MKLLIIRHADPNYEKDTLTEKGWKEAKLLSDRIAAMDIKDFYVSPLGRARDTANVTLNKINRTAEVLPWLREFDVLICDEETGRLRICWISFRSSGQRSASIIIKTFGIPRRRTAKTTTSERRQTGFMKESTRFWKNTDISARAIYTAPLIPTEIP